MSKYCVSDLHGMLDLYKMIKNFIKADDIVYCLGDCGDRGPNSWELIKAVCKDPQFIYLKGNHEDMLVKAALELRKSQYDIVSGTAFNSLCYNGGYETIEGLLNEEQSSGWIKYLLELPTHIEITNSSGIEILLSHAGYTPDIIFPTHKELMWNRDHYYDAWPNKSNAVVIHGHTPNQLLWKDFNDIEKQATGIELPPYEKGAFYYAKNKICIDCGSWVSGHTVLLDLDTFDEHIFEIVGYEESLKNK